MKLPRAVTRALNPQAAGRTRRGATLAVLAALAVGAVGLAACSSRPAVAPGAAVAPGEVLHGRMVAGREEQAFTFEGVESSLLDFTVQADDGSEAAPVVALYDPEGRPIDVSGATKTRPGAATVKVQGVPLTATGTYRVAARPSFPGRTVYYGFSHELRFPTPPPAKVHLTPGSARPVYVAAPRGGLVAIEIDPEGASGLVPDVQGVEDPWGGPALDPAQVPPGALPPRVSHTFDGTMILTFTAPRPGLYTIFAAARPGSEGVGTISVQVRSPAPRHQVVLHDARPAGAFGLPGALEGTPDGEPRFPPPAPPAPPRARSAAPQPPVDPALAQR